MNIQIVSTADGINSFLFCDFVYLFFFDSSRPKKRALAILLIDYSEF